MDIYVYNGKALQYNGKCISPKATGETWLLNGSIASPNIKHTWNVNFISNGTAYTKLTWSDNPRQILEYDSTAVYKEAPDPFWLDQAYRTITFDAAPTGELLTFLQANGTKQ